VLVPGVGWCSRCLEVCLGSPTASSYAARRLRHFTVDCRTIRQARRPALSPASRVSISELLGATRVQPMIRLDTQESPKHRLNHPHSDWKKKRGGNGTD